AASPAPLDLWLDATGPVSRRVRLGSGTLPAGATVTRAVRVRLPPNTPGGAYTFDLHIGAFPDDVCDTVTFAVTVSAPRVGAGVVGGSAFEVVSGFAAGASAVAAAPSVSPNPFARRATIAYEVVEAADVRLAVYDVLG